MAHEYEQRNSRRFRESAIIRFSHFNRNHFHSARILNYGDQGMCFQSDVSLAPGAVVCIRLKSTPRHEARESHGRGLRSLTLAETKWCQKVADEAQHHYRIGVKYFQPGY
ncbi:MAG: hypothetical protein QNI97_12265 [Desulfobacterales bacterium]|nr:hypothetical protein [Desulfobacterales bacterium]